MKRFDEKQFQVASLDSSEELKAWNCIIANPYSSEPALIDREKYPCEDFIKLDTGILNNHAINLIESSIGYEDIRGAEDSPEFILRLHYDGNLEFGKMLPIIKRDIEIDNDGALTDLLPIIKKGQKFISSETIYQHTFNILLFYGRVYHKINYLDSLQIYYCLKGIDNTYLDVSLKTRYSMPTPRMTFDKHQFVYRLETNVENLLDKPYDVTVKVMNEVWGSYKWGDFVKDS